MSDLNCGESFFAVNFERLVCILHGHDRMRCKSSVHFSGSWQSANFKKY